MNQTRTPVCRQQCMRRWMLSTASWPQCLMRIRTLPSTGKCPARSSPSRLWGSAWHSVLHTIAPHTQCSPALLCLQRGKNCACGICTKTIIQSRFAVALQSQLEPECHKHCRCQLYVTCEPCIMCAGALSLLQFEKVGRCDPPNTHGKAAWTKLEV